MLFRPPYLVGAVLQVLPDAEARAVAVLDKVDDGGAWNSSSDVGEVAPHVALTEHEELQPLVTAGLLLVDGHVALVAARAAS